MPSSSLHEARRLHRCAFSSRSPPVSDVHRAVFTLTPRQAACPVRLQLQVHAAPLRVCALEAQKRLQKRGGLSGSRAVQSTSCGVLGPPVGKIPFYTSSHRCPSFSAHPLLYPLINRPASCKITSLPAGRRRESWGKAIARPGAGTWQPCGKGRYRLLLGPKAHTNEARRWTGA